MGSAVPEQHQFAAPGPGGAALDSLAAAWLSGEEQRCSAGIQQVLLGSRKPSTQATYVAKWKRFTFWASDYHIRAEEVPLQDVLDCLLHLKLQGLLLSSVMVHLVAISVFHPLFQDRSIFAHPMMVRILKGPRAPLPACPGPPWDLNLVLSSLMGLFPLSK